MTGPKPAIDPSLLTPDEWQQYLGNARKALHQNPKDREALDAIRHANFALSVYDEAAAASPGERISSGISEGAAGLGQAASDIPNLALNAVLHPINTASHVLRPTQQDVQGILDRLTHGSQRDVGRVVGNIGTALLPFAKTSAAPGAPTVGEVGVRAATYPIRLAGALARRPFLRNAILEAQLQRLTQSKADVAPTVTNTPPVTARPRLPAVQPTEPLDAPTYLRRAGEAAVPGRPDLGVLRPAGNGQTAGSPLRTESPSPSSSIVPQQMQMIVDALKGVPRSEWPAKLAPFQALGMISDAELSQLLAAH